jgi:hypothetical protein
MKTEMQQMTECLLAGQEQMMSERRADQARVQADQEEMKQERRADQAKAEAD